MLWAPSDLALMLGKMAGMPEAAKAVQASVKLYTYDEVWEGREGGNWGGTRARTRRLPAGFNKHSKRRN